jgi:proteasome lid subunit RPN8/RPN11
MNFGVKKLIEPHEVSNELAGKIYPNTELQNDKIDNDFVTLDKICNVFSNRATLHPEIVGKNFTCYIEKNAFDAFVRFANETYQNRHHEATGLIIGYYLHDKDNPDSKFIVGTHFLSASGNTTGVTCEFSYQDSIDHSNKCNEHKLLPLIWIHSHPGFGAFYSGTDDFTLKSYFYANHQTGVVVDNLKNEVLGYKMYGEKKQEEDVFIFDLDKSNSNHLELVYTQLNKKKKKEMPPIINPTRDDDSKKKEKEIETKTEGKTENVKALETKVENLENEIATLKKGVKIQRLVSNVIICTFSILFVLFLVEGAVLIVNFKQTNDLEKRFVEFLEKVEQQLDSLKNSIATPTIIEDIVSKEATKPEKTETLNNQETKPKSETVEPTVQKPDTADKKDAVKPATDNTEIKKDSI